MPQSLAKPSLLEILWIILLRIIGNFLKQVWWKSYTRESLKRNWVHGVMPHGWQVISKNCQGRRKDSLHSKRFLASSSRKLGGEQTKKKGMTGKGEGNEGTRLPANPTILKKCVRPRKCKGMWISTGTAIVVYRYGPKTQLIRGMYPTLSRLIIPNNNNNNNKFISLSSWRYCVLGEWDLAAEPPRAVKPREILKFWRRSRDLKKGVGTRRLKYFSRLRRSWRFRRQISLDW